MTLLSLDTSTMCVGWAVYENAEYQQSSFINLEEIDDTNKRIQCMALKMHTLIKEISPDSVIIELTVVPRNPHTQRLLDMLLGVTMGYCVLYDIEYIQVRPSEWRSWVNDEKKPRNREELKQWSIDTVNTLFNKNVNDDEADAILIGYGYCRWFEKQMLKLERKQKQ